MVHWRRSAIFALAVAHSRALSLPADTPQVVEDKKAKKKAKKEKAAADAATASGSDADADADAPAAAVASPAEPEPEPVPAANPLALDNFKLSAPVKSLLRAKGIESLFEIQASCLLPLLEGQDLVGRARTGCGKTLAFVLPIVEKLAGSAADATTAKRAYGRPPSVVVLAPTRELAKQVCGWGGEFKGGHV